jgi:hypothetical protein
MIIPHVATGKLYFVGKSILGAGNSLGPESASIQDTFFKKGQLLEQFCTRKCIGKAQRLKAFSGAADSRTVANWTRGEWSQSIEQVVVS